MYGGGKKKTKSLFSILVFLSPSVHCHSYAFVNMLFIATRDSLNILFY